MRLLKASTLEFEEFLGNSIPSYAILSHTWSEEEVTLKDFELGREKSKIGYQKILKTCEKTLADDLEYAWIDTCCIDKSSSAELSEAINSMYNWYSQSKICYVHLEDAESFNLQDEKDAEEFGKCRWFSRGWTLQELIAPSKVVFYSRDWIEFGRRQDISDYLSRITGIDPEYLKNPTSEQLFAFSIAKRMSWASKRKTTRVEDMSYCLLGLFDVHIPLLYGEGGEAFIRLQEEIIKQYYDHSIFAWGEISSILLTAPYYIPFPTRIYDSLLARSPAMFRDSANIVSFEPRDAIPYTFTNRGLSIQLRLKRQMLHNTALLNCYCLNDLDHELAIPTAGDGEQQSRISSMLYRFNRKEIEDMRSRNGFQPSILRFSSSLSSVYGNESDPRRGFIFVPRSSNYRISEAKPDGIWNADRHLIMLDYQMKSYVQLQLEFRLPAGDSFKWRRDIAVYIQADYWAEPRFFYLIGEIPADQEVQKTIQNLPIYQWGPPKSIKIFERGRVFNISIELVREDVLGQDMDVLYIHLSEVSDRGEKKTLRLKSLSTYMKKSFKLGRST